MKLSRLLLNLLVLVPFFLPAPNGHGRQAIGPNGAWQGPPIRSIPAALSLCVTTLKGTMGTP
jgi:hypothetical protein